MRITNNMMSNTMLIDINRNMNYLDKISTQIASTKKIQVPSDDPIIASRSLKFRTNVTEIEQFQRNVQSGLGWMDVTESSFTNIIEDLLVSFRKRCVEGATGSETGEDKRNIVTELRQLIEQIKLDMNQTYAGRYVFSGYRTDQPPVLEADNKDASYIITQTFTANDIEKAQSYQKVLADITLEDENGNKILDANGNEIPVTTNEPLVHDINVLKLAYKKLDQVNPSDPASDPMLSIPGYTVVMKSVSDSTAYDPEALKGTGANGPIIHYIHETGELVMSDDTAANFPKDGVEVSYQKTGFSKGELNPLVYFECYLTSDAISAKSVPADNYDATKFTNGSNATYQMTQFFSAADMSSIGGGIFMSQLAYKDLKNISLPSDFTVATSPSTIDLNVPGNVLFDPVSGQLRMSAATAAMFDKTPVTFEKTGFNPGDTNPLANSTAIPPLDPLSTRLISGVDPNYYAMANQDVRYEVNSGTFIAINSLACNVFTDKMYADLMSLCDFVDSLTLSDETQLREYYKTVHELEGEDLDKAINDQLTAEQGQMQAVLYDRFNNMLYLVDRHSENAMKEHTSLGSRMYRLELMQARLEQDETSYTQLLSDNEDTDMYTASMQKAVAESAYQAALSVSARITQLSLANFIG